MVGWGMEPGTRRVRGRLARVAGVCACIALAACHRPTAEPTRDAGSADAGAADAGAPGVVRCAVIGGMVTSGLWSALSKRYEAETGARVELTVSGNRRMIVDPMRRGDVDLITMHASDAIVNLVADGYAQDPQPWARNDHVIVGPTDDPAGVRGMKDAARALAKIVEKRSPFVVHRGAGVAQVLHELLEEAHVALRDDQVSQLPATDNQENVLELAARKHAYSLVGRIPFKVGKMQGPGLEILVQGDRRLQRPYLVAVADPRRSPGAHVAAAQRLAAYLRSPATQAWLAAYSSTTFGDEPPFYPVAVPGEDAGTPP
jgi:tungstate transport system substrate-binding protein